MWSNSVSGLRLNEISFFISFNELFFSLLSSAAINVNIRLLSTLARQVEST